MFYGFCSLLHSRANPPGYINKNKIPRPGRPCSVFISSTRCFFSSWKSIFYSLSTDLIVHYNYTDHFLAPDHWPLGGIACPVVWRAKHRICCNFIQQRRTIKFTSIVCLPVGYSHKTKNTLLVLFRSQSRDKQ